MPDTAATQYAYPSLKTSERVDDSDIRLSARVVFARFGNASTLYALKKVKQMEAEGNIAAVAVWVRIAGVVQTFEGMEASTAIHQPRELTGATSGYLDKSARSRRGWASSPSRATSHPSWRSRR